MQGLWFDFCCSFAWWTEPFLALASSGSLPQPLMKRRGCLLSWKSGLRGRIRGRGLGGLCWQGSVYLCSSGRLRGEPTLLARSRGRTGSVSDPHIGQQPTWSWLSLLGFWVPGSHGQGWHSSFSKDCRGLFSEQEGCESWQHVTESRACERGQCPTLLSGLEVHGASLLGGEGRVPSSQRKSKESSIFISFCLSCGLLQFTNLNSLLFFEVRSDRRLGRRKRPRSNGTSSTPGIASLSASTLTWAATHNAPCRLARALAME